MPQVAAAVEALDAAHIAGRIGRGGEIGIAIDGTDHTLEADDLTLACSRSTATRWSRAGHAVALALELNESCCARAWLARSVHAVPDRSQRSGLDITDRIALTLGGDEGLLAAAREHEAYLAARSSPPRWPTTAPRTRRGRIDGRNLSIAVRRS